MKLSYFDVIFEHRNICLYHVLFTWNFSLLQLKFDLMILKLKQVQNNLTKCLFSMAKWRTKIGLELNKIAVHHNVLISEDQKFLETFTQEITCNLFCDIKLFAIL